MTQLRDRARRWWARQPIPFRASVATLVWSFLGAVGAQAARLADDMQTWLFDSGPEPDWLSTGSAVWTAAATLLGALGNLWYRSRRPAAYWPAPSGDPIPNPAPQEG